MAFIPAAAGHVGAKHQKSVIDLLRERRALRREAAQPLPDLSKMQRRVLEQAVDRGTVRLAAGNRYYLDEDALGIFTRGNSRSRSLRPSSPRASRPRGF